MPKKCDSGLIEELHFPSNLLVGQARQQRHLLLFLGRRGAGLDGLEGER